MGYEKKTTMNTNIFVGQFSGFIGQRQNKTRVMINLTIIPKALIPLNGDGDPDLPSGRGSYRCDRE